MPLPASPRPDEPDIHIRLCYPGGGEAGADLVIDHIACVTAARQFLAGIEQRGSELKVALVEPAGDHHSVYPRLSCESLWAAPEHVRSTPHRPAGREG